MATRSYSIVGTGALGGYYGARLHHGGQLVRFLLHSDAPWVREHGLRVESRDGDFSIPDPVASDDPRDLPASDIVALCLKTTENRLLPEILPAIAGDARIVLVMQNGLGVEEQVARVLPDRTIVGGLSFLCSNKIGPGHIRHLDYGLVRLAEYRADGSAAGVTETMRHIGEDLGGAGIPIELDEDLELARWRKLVWNVPFNGLCTLHGCTTDAIMGDATRSARAEALMEEVVRAADARGKHIDRAFVDVMLDSTRRMAPYDPSMKLDHERGRPMEIEAIYTRPLEVARTAGVPCPEMETLREQLLALDGKGTATIS